MYMLKLWGRQFVESNYVGRGKYWGVMGVGYMDTE